MPKYIDYHAKLPPLPPDAMKKFAEDMKAGKPNQFGVKPINLLVGKNGDGYCLCEAPNADAVVKSHDAIGAKINKNDIREVTALV